MKRKSKLKLRQAITYMGLYIVTEIAFYNVIVWVLDNCMTTVR